MEYVAYEEERSSLAFDGDVGFAKTLVNVNKLEPELVIRVLVTNSGVVTKVDPSEVWVTATGEVNVEAGGLTN